MQALQNRKRPGMTAITIEKFAGKMNRLGYEGLLQAMRQARGDGNRNVELSHWLFRDLASGWRYRGDAARPGAGPGPGAEDHWQAIDRLAKNVTGRPAFPTAGGCAEPRLDLCDAVLWRGADQDQASAGGAAERPDAAARGRASIPRSFRRHVRRTDRGRGAHPLGRFRGRDMRPMDGTGIGLRPPRGPKGRGRRRWGGSRST